MINSTNVTTELCERAANLLQAWSNHPKQSVLVAEKIDLRFIVSLAVIGTSLFLLRKRRNSTREPILLALRNFGYVANGLCLWDLAHRLAEKTSLGTIEQAVTCLKTGLNCPKP